MTTESGHLTNNLNLFHGGEKSEIKGIPEEDIEIWKKKLKNSNNGKRIRFISQWLWWDIIEDRTTKKIISDNKLKSSAIYSSNIIFCGDNPTINGLHVKTSLLQKFEEGVLFITRNTIYVLVGPGHRADITPRAFNNIYL